MTECLILLGSNECRQQNMMFARQRLQMLFPDIYFSLEVETPAQGMKRKDSFSNQTARFMTALPKEEVVNLLKRIEQEAGRQPNHKEQEIILLDIDLVTYGNELLKPKEMKMINKLLTIE